MCERQELLASDALTLASRHSVTAGENCEAQRLPMYATLLGCDGVTPSAQQTRPCALEPRAVVATSAGAPAPLRRDRRRSDRRGAIGRKSWPFDIRLRPWVFRPHIGLLPLRYIAAGDVHTVATNGLESGRFPRVFAGFNGLYVRSGRYGEVWEFFWSSRLCGGFSSVGSRRRSLWSF